MIYNRSIAIEMNALSYAAQQNNPKIVQILLKRKNINVHTFQKKNSLKKKEFYSKLEAK